MSSLSGLAGAPSLTKKGGARVSTFDSDFESLLEGRGGEEKRGEGRTAAEDKKTSKISTTAQSRNVKFSSEIDYGEEGEETRGEERPSPTKQRRKTPTANPKGLGAAANLQAAYTFLEEDDDDGLGGARHRRGRSGLSREEQDAEFQKLLMAANASEPEYRHSGGGNAALQGRPGTGQRQDEGTKPRGVSALIDDVLGLTEDAFIGKAPHGRPLAPPAPMEASKSNRSLSDDMPHQHEYTQQSPAVGPLSPMSPDQHETSDWDASAVSLPLSDGSGKRSRLKTLAVDEASSQQEPSQEESAGLLSDSAFDAAFSAGFGGDDAAAAKNTNTFSLPSKPSQPSLSILGGAGQQPASSLSLLAGSNNAQQAPLPAEDHLDSLLNAGRRRRPAAAGFLAEPTADLPARGLAAKAPSPAPQEFAPDAPLTPPVQTTAKRMSTGERRRLAHDLGLDTPFVSPEVKEAMQSPSSAKSPIAALNLSDAQALQSSPRQSSYFRDTSPQVPRRSVEAPAKKSPKPQSSRVASKEEFDYNATSPMPPASTQPLEQPATSTNGSGSSSMPAERLPTSPEQTPGRSMHSFYETEIAALNARWGAKVAALQVEHDNEIAELRRKYDSRADDTLTTARLSSASEVRTLQSRITTLEKDLAEARLAADRRLVELTAKLHTESETLANERASSAVTAARAHWESERAAIDRRAADETSFLRKLHGEEVEAWRQRLQESSEVNLLAAQVRAIAKSLEDVQHRLSVEASQVTALRSSQLDAREKLLLDLEARAKAANQHAESETRRLQSLLTTIETALAGQRRDVEEDRARLQAEQNRINAWQAVVASEAEANRKATMAERQSLAGLRADIEQERRQLMSDASKAYHDAQLARESADKLKMDAMAECQRLTSDCRAELSMMTQSIDNLRVELSHLTTQRDNVAAELRRLQGELSTAAVERASLEAARKSQEAEAQRVADGLATASAALEDAKRERAAAVDELKQAKMLHASALAAQQTAEAERVRMKSTMDEIAEERRVLAEERANLSRERQALVVAQRPKPAVGAAYHLRADAMDHGVDLMMNRSTLQAGIVPSVARSTDPKSVVPPPPMTLGSSLRRPSFQPTPETKTMDEFNTSGALDRTAMRRMLAEWQQDSARATEALLSDHDKLMRSLADRTVVPRAVITDAMPVAQAAQSVGDSSQMSYERFRAPVSGDAANSTFGGLEGTLASLTRLSDAHSTS